MKKTSDMELLTTTQTSKKSGIVWKTLTLALCGALTFGNISCGKTTWKDVADKQEIIESLSSDISYLIWERKKVVEDYNKLLAYPRSSENEKDIKKSLNQMYEVIVKYDEDIADLLEDRIDAIGDLRECIPDAGGNFAPNTPADPAKWDFFFTIK